MEKEISVPAVSTTPQYVSVKVFYLAVLLVSLAMSVFALVVYDRYFTIKFASFDLPGYAMQIQEAQAARKLSEEDAGKLLSNIRQQIDALPPKYVVISGDAILGNAPKIEKLNFR